MTGNRHIWPLSTAGEFLSVERGNSTYYHSAVPGRDGVYFLTDTFAHRVFSLDSAGTIIDEWGGPGDGPGQFRYPRGLAAVEEPEGLFIYVCDSWNGRVQKLTDKGEAVGNLRPPEAGRFEPYDVRAGGREDVLVVDRGGHRLWWFSEDGNVKAVTGRRGSLQEREAQEWVAGFRRARSLPEPDCDSVEPSFEYPSSALTTTSGLLVIDNESVRCLGSPLGASRRRLRGRLCVRGLRELGKICVILDEASGELLLLTPDGYLFGSRSLPRDKPWTPVPLSSDETELRLIAPGHVRFESVPEAQWSRERCLVAAGEIAEDSHTLEQVSQELARTGDEEATCRALFRLKQMTGSSSRFWCSFRAIPLPASYHKPFSEEVPSLKDLLLEAVNACRVLYREAQVAAPGIGVARRLGHAAWYENPLLSIELSRRHRSTLEELYSSWEAISRITAADSALRDRKIISPLIELTDRFLKEAPGELTGRLGSRIPSPLRDSRAEDLTVRLVLAVQWILWSERFDTQAPSGNPTERWIRLLLCDAEKAARLSKRLLRLNHLLVIADERVKRRAGRDEVARTRLERLALIRLWEELGLYLDEGFVVPPDFARRTMERLDQTAPPGTKNRREVLGKLYQCFPQENEFARALALESLASDDFSHELPPLNLAFPSGTEAVPYLMEQAQSAFQQGRRDTALLLLREIEERVAEEAPQGVFRLRAAIELARGDSDSALSYLHREIRRFPHEPEAYADLAGLLRRRRFSWSALRFTEQGLRNNPSHGSLLDLGIGLSFDLGEFSAAFEKIQRRREEREPTVSDLSYQGMCLYFLGSSSEGSECFQKVLGLESGNQWAKLWLIITGPGRTDEGRRSWALEALSSAEPFAWAAFYYAAVFARLEGARQRAALLLEKAVKAGLDPVRAAMESWLIDLESGQTRGASWSTFSSVWENLEGVRRLDLWIGESQRELLWNELETARSTDTLADTRLSDRNGPGPALHLLLLRDEGGS